MELQREQVWNVRVLTARMAEILNLIDEGITDGAMGRTLFCANPHSLVVAKDDRLFLEALHQADILIPDGSGIVLASRVLGGTIHERITGSDMMTGIAERWNALKSRSFFFLGSSDEVLERIKARMMQMYPGINVCGLYAPPFKREFSEEENERMIEIVNRAAPTVLWVGMTAPKQEKWVYQNRSRLKVPLIAAVGAAFDYFAGTKKRASVSAQNIGLEWLPRLMREPRRMWRRNLVSTPVFLYNILRQKLLSPQSAAGGESTSKK